MTILAPLFFDLAAAPTVFEGETIVKNEGGGLFTFMCGRVYTYMTGAQLALVEQDSVEFPTGKVWYDEVESLSGFNATLLDELDRNQKHTAVASFLAPLMKSGGLVATKTIFKGRDGDFYLHALTFLDGRWVVSTFSLRYKWGGIMLRPTESF